MPFAKVGDIIEVEQLSFIKNEYCTHEYYPTQLIEKGWIAEVEEEKELWEKLVDYKDGHYVSDTYWMKKARITRQHFAEVARKARDEWYRDRHTMLLCDFIIQAIEKDGEK